MAPQKVVAHPFHRRASAMAPRTHVSLRNTVQIHLFRHFPGFPSFCLNRGIPVIVCVTPAAGLVLQGVAPTL